MEDSQRQERLPDLFELYFDGSLAGAPYDSAEEELRERAYLADMYLHGALLCEQDAEQDPAQDSFSQARGTVMGAFRFNRDVMLSEELCGHIRSAWEHVESRSAAGGGPMTELLRRFAPDTFSQLFLFLAAAVRLDGRHEKVLSHLQGDAERVWPTAELAAGLCRLTGGAPLAECLAHTRTRAWELLYETRTEGFRLRENVFFTLLGMRVSGAREGGVCDPLPCRSAREAADAEYGRRTRERVCEAVRRARGRPETLVVCLWGPEGSGRMRTVLSCAESGGWEPLILRGGALAGLDAQRLHERTVRVASDAAVSGFVPVVADADALGPRAAGLCEELRLYGVRVLFLLSRAADAVVRARGCIPLRFEMGAVDAAQAVELWRKAAARFPLAPGTDLRVLSSKYRLGPGQIVETVGAAALLAPQGVVREEDLAAAVMNAGQSALSRQCVKITPMFTFKDLILPEAARRQVRAILDRVRDAYRVNVEWGFGARYAYGKGISVLMFGRPGTGKTMCAQVLAHELQLELYKADLSQVVSKYIGETEKNISDIFRSARQSNAILFFDEADSLFSKRTADIGGSNDKYANMETAHLLQKMEEFDGITILATNLAGTLDKAFYRRLQFVINIPLPDEETRLTLWQRSFPERCPLEAQVDFVPLARQHEISPSTIKTAALGAAFRATAEGSPTVGMRHIVLSLRDELAKEGKTMSRQEMLGIDPD